jgi:hypothetical protein
LRRALRVGRAMFGRVWSGGMVLPLSSDSSPPVISRTVRSLPRFIILGNLSQTLDHAADMRSQDSSDATAFHLDRTEAYGYDDKLDYLTSASYTPNGDSTTTNTWTYEFGIVYHFRR